jgi:hypothetical protein
MKEDLNILAKGRQPQYFGRWKTTSIFWQVEDDINGRHTHCFQLEDDLNFLIGKAGQAYPSLS